MAACGQNDPGLLPFVLSGHSREEVEEQARDLLRRPEQALEAHRLASRLAARASPLPHRAVVLSPGGEDLSGRLAALAAGRKTGRLFEGEARTPSRIAFVFSPLRAEYPGVGADLLAHPSLHRPLQRCAAALSGLVEWSLEEVLRETPGGPPFERLDVSQPLLFAVSVALAELWRSVGVEPDAVVGHSVGEIAAAVSCGALSLQEAARVAATWGRSSMRMEGAGQMVSLPLAAEAAAGRIAPWDGRLWIAGLNAPTWTAVSGEDEAAEELLGELAAEGIHGRPMGISAPGHSPGMDPVHPWFLEELADVSPRQGAVPFYSAATGDRVAATDLDAGYWSANLRGPVLFEPAIRAIRRDGCDVFVEIGPRPVLAPALEEIVGSDGALVLGTLERGAPDSFLGFLGRSYAHGVDVEWPAVLKAIPPLPPGSSSRPLSLPGNGVQDGDLLDLVLGEVADARGLSPAAIDPDRPFKELGFDSAAVVELRNALNRIAGLALPATLAFDHPTPRKVAEKMRLELEGSSQEETVRPEDTALDDRDLAALVEVVLDQGERKPELS
ncbi:MAG TPA: acyltransferase domain-containing protein [Solirubrobacterales bacterium]|nr:acyltransferase domain-containing protein [Solirubrobacterales bacterium]